jgi:uncharacterized protein (DUF1697 family)
MTDLKHHLEALGFSNVVTYIQSGNVILQTELPAGDVEQSIQGMLPQRFTLDSPLIKVLVVSFRQLQFIIDHKPPGFGEDPETYHSDVIFLMDITPEAALKVFSPRDGVDNVWKGREVIYSQRLSAQRTKSRLGKIVGTPAYKSMTIRNWNTTTKLLSLMATLDSKPQSDSSIID